MLRAATLLPVLVTLCVGCGPGDPAELTTEGDAVGECNDGQDNDDDGLVDCDDLGCAGKDGCEGNTTTIGTLTSTGDSFAETPCTPVPFWVMTVDFGWDEVTEEILPFTLLDTTIQPALSFNYGPANWDGNLQDSSQFCWVTYEINDWSTDVQPLTGHIMAIGGTIAVETPVSTSCLDFNACLDDFAGYDSPTAVVVGNTFQVHITETPDESLDEVISKDMESKVFGGTIVSDALPSPQTTPLIGFGHAYGEGGPLDADITLPLRDNTDSISGGRLTDGVYSFVAPTLFGWSR